MTKSELKNGAVVECRNGERFFKIDNTLIQLSLNGWMQLDSYSENLKNLTSCNYDIIAVENNPIVLDKYCHGSIVRVNRGYLTWTWERKEETIMTVSEIEDKLGIKNLKIVRE